MPKTWLIAFTLLILTSASLSAQTGATRPRQQVPLLKSTAARPLEEQIQPVHQQVLQDWFLDNVEFFYHDYDNLALSRHPSFRLGTTAPFLRLLGPPRGNAGPGTVPLQIRFSDVDAGGNPLLAPTAEEPYIWFPRNNISTTGGNVNTCWHEMMHAILDGVSLSGVEGDCPETWNGGFHQERQEHLYIENVQNQLSWYETLEFFEREVRKTGLEVRKVLSAQRAWAGGASVTFSPTLPIISFDRLNYDLERQLFAECHRLWFNPLQQRTLDHACWFRDELVKELEQVARVRMPTPDQVIAFYMEGGIKDQHGVPIRVPEWVFVPEPDQLREIVFIGLGTVKKEEKGDEELHSVKVNVSEFYRQPPGVRTSTPDAYVGTRPVTRGVVSIELRDSDRYAGLYVRLIDANGKPVRNLTSTGGSTRGGYFEVDLFKDRAVLEQGGSLELAASFVEKQKLKKDHTYVVDLRYRDQAYPTAVPSPAIYVPVARQLWLQVKKGGSAPPKATKPQQPTPPTAVAQGPAWELQETKVERWDLSSPDADQYFMVDTYKYYYEPGYSSRALIGRGSASAGFSGEHKREKKVHRMDVEASWTDPGDRLPSGVHDYELRVAEVGGALNNLRTSVSVTCSFYWGVQPYLPKLGDSYNNPALAATYHGYGSLSLGNPPASVKDDYHPDIPVGSPGQTLQLIVELRTEVSVAKLTMTYGWVPDTVGKKPPEDDVIIEVYLPPPPPDPPWDGKLDNISDEGPYVPPPVEEPTKGVPTRWFYHAEKGYRLPLLPDWVVYELPEDEIDLLIPPEENLLLSCGRGHSVLEEQETPAQALSRLTGSLLEVQPGTTSTEFPLGRGQAIRVEYYDEEEEQSLVHVYVHDDGWIFYLVLMSPPGEGRFSFPKEVWEMLRKIDFIEDRERERAPAHVPHPRHPVGSESR